MQNAHCGEGEKGAIASIRAASRSYDLDKLIGSSMQMSHPVHMVSALQICFVSKRTMTTPNILEDTSCYWECPASLSINGMDSLAAEDCTRNGDNRVGWRTVLEG